MRRDRAYFDTSVITKRYLLEAGSVQARKLFRTHRIVTSAVAPAEIVSAMQRRVEAGDLRARDFKAIQSRIAQDRNCWELIEVTSQVLDRAELLVVQVGLRTLDAIHMASLLAFESKLGRLLPFVTGDVRQRSAAERLQHEAIWVGYGQPYSPPQIPARFGCSL